MHIKGVSINNKTDFVTTVIDSATEIGNGMY